MIDECIYKIPESVLVVIHTPALEVLLIKRAYTPITLAPREHSAYCWLPWREAADKCFSPSNAEPCLLLPQFAA